MKKNLKIGIFVLAAVLMLAACGQKNTESTEASSEAETASAVVSVPTTQYFTDDEVSDEDMTAILTAGINAQSGMNAQPWHFTAVTDPEVLNQIAEDMSAGMPEGAGGSTAAKAGIADAPLAIIISASEGSEFDAGLACESMCFAANSLGYGTKILGSPAIAINGDKKEEYKELLGIPEDMEFVDAVIVGVADESVEGYTGATERNAFDDVVTYVKGSPDH